ncbi:DEKNAAC102238 [Brettanomyces naardenensis]|uniref:THO complex subunit 2 n=1 Tax=Brettanomyces naardenensis TaxID=13370 RepID=A0A448YL99_BRENA|nr:DEKNAAC102238 [Brettanomyces naardenensis]
MSTESTASVADTSDAPDREWKYLGAETLKEWKNTEEELVNKVKADRSILDELFYEIVLSLQDDPERISEQDLLSLTNSILGCFPNIRDREDISVEFLLIFQAINPGTSLIHFIESVNIDLELKNQYLDPNILKQSLFLDYNRMYYLDARLSNYGLDAYSSLGESSEGYSKFIAEVASFLRRSSGSTSGIDQLGSIINVMERVIGHFKLDTNRCFLLLLSILGPYVELKPELVNCFIDGTPWWKPNEANTSIESTLVTYLTNSPIITSGEMRIIVLLVKKGILQFDSIFNSLDPVDFETADANYSITAKDSTEMDQLQTQFNTELQEEAFRSTASALALAAPLIKDDSDEEGDVRNRGEVTKVEAHKVQVKPKTASVKSKLKTMQKIQFISYILKFRMYDSSIFALAQYPFLPAIEDRIADLINEFMRFLIEPYYRELVRPVNITLQRKEVAQAVPSIIDTSSLFKVCNEFLMFNGVKIARDPVLISKLVRIMAESLAGGEDKEIWLQFFRKFIFPSSNFVNNMATVNEIFAVLKRYYPLQVRYNLYGEYQTVLVKNALELKLNYGVTEKKTKDLMKRLSIENLSTSLRRYTKIVCSNPLASTNAFVSHIESYNSLTDLVVESSRMLNEYSWEALSFQILNKFTDNRLAVQEDGLNYTLWFQNLCEFVGRLAKKYPERFQLEPILELIVKSLNGGSTQFVLLFSEIVASMSGIKQINNLNPKQIFMLNSEQSIKQIVYSVIQDERMDCRRTGKKLISLLVPTGYLCELFVLLCKLPSKIIQQSKKIPLKILNQKCDELYSLIHTFSTAVEENISSSIFTQHMLPVEELIKDYQIEPAWAFQIWRRHWSRAIKKQLTENTDLTVLDGLRKNLPGLIPEVNWDLLTTTFYSTFWQLSLYEIDFGRISYLMELADVKTRIAVDRRKLNDRRDLNYKEEKRLGEEIRLLSGIVSVIRKDETKHRENFKLVSQRLENEKATWFADVDLSDTTKTNECVKHILEYCVLPRSLHSSFDAAFVAEFIFAIHKMNTPGFSLLVLLDDLFNGGLLGTTLFTSTQTETENLAIFFEQALAKLNEWRAEKSVYEKEALGLKEHTIKNDGTDAMDVDESPELCGMLIPGDLGVVNHEEFRKRLYGWHSQLLEQVVKSLDSEYYTTRNNAVIFAKGLLSSFPVVEDQGDILKERVSSIAASDPREDIKLACNALYGLVASKKSKMIPVWEFYTLEEAEKQNLMKKRNEKLEAVRKKEEAEEKERKEKERKEEEIRRAKESAEVKVRAAERTKAAMKSETNIRPYGLVGLDSVKKVTPEKTEVEKEKAEKEKAEKEKETKEEESKVEKIPETKEAENKVIDVAQTEEAKEKQITKGKEEAAPTHQHPHSSPSIESRSTSNSGRSTPRGPGNSKTNGENSKDGLRARLEEEKRINRMRAPHRTSRSIPRGPGRGLTPPLQVPSGPDSLQRSESEKLAPLPPPPTPPPPSRQRTGGSSYERERPRNIRDNQGRKRRGDYDDRDRMKRSRYGK